MQRSHLWRRAGGPVSARSTRDGFVVCSPSSCRWPASPTSPGLRSSAKSIRSARRHGSAVSPLAGFAFLGSRSRCGGWGCGTTPRPVARTSRRQGPAGDRLIAQAASDGISLRVMCGFSRSRGLWSVPLLHRGDAAWRPRGTSIFPKKVLLRMTPLTPCPKPLINAIAATAAALALTACGGGGSGSGFSLPVSQAPAPAPASQAAAPAAAPAAAQPQPQCLRRRVR